MSREMEDRLRAAYQAKAEQVTDRRLAQLRAERDSQLATLLSEDVPIARLEHPPVQLDSRRHRHSRWFAPAVAAAAVAAVAAAAFALSQPGPHRNVPTPPASHISSPTSSATPSVSSSPSSATASSTGSAEPSYLPAGRTGSRTDVPWTQVGPGWRLIQPSIDAAKSSGVYLYDPVGGRYLISDQLPGLAILKAWSPDGQRAMFQTFESGDYIRFQELDLHSGQLAAGFTQYQGSFVGYTQPRGLAVVVEGQVQGAGRLLRYGTDGTMQLIYPPEVTAAASARAITVLYSPDGSQFLASDALHSALVTNGGQLVRQYRLPRPTDDRCEPLRWWTADRFLEACGATGSGAFVSSLYLQPVAGDAPTRLMPQSDESYDYAWPLTNADVLLSRDTGCGATHLDVLHPDGTVVPFVWPAEVPDPSHFLSLSGDLATFEVIKSGQGCGSNGPADGLVDYNMITGATQVLTHTLGNVVGYPGTD